MPINKGCSISAFRENVSMLIREGRERDQALAIAISTLKKACGVTSEKRMTPQGIVRAGKKKK